MRWCECIPYTDEGVQALTGERWMSRSPGNLFQVSGV